MKNKFKRCALLLASSSLLAAHSVTAANALYNAGDLVLTFQKIGSSNTVYANLGNAATQFRGSTAGTAGGTNHLNIIDLSTTLEAAFGTGWQSDTGIYMGAVGVYSTDESTQDLVNGDPARALYVSKARTAVGTSGLANSTAWSLATGGDTAMSTAANNIFASNNVLETAETNSLTTIALTSVSQIDNQNPFLSGTIQGTAYGVFGGGVQQAGSASSYAQFAYGPSGTNEFMLDLYRMVAVEGIDGQVAGTGLPRRSTYEGTILVGSNGMASFVAIPEPSSLALGGLAAGALVLRRRRSA